MNLPDIISGQLSRRQFEQIAVANAAAAVMPVPGVSAMAATSAPALLPLGIDLLSYHVYLDAAFDHPRLDNAEMFLLRTPEKVIGRRNDTYFVENMLCAIDNGNFDKLQRDIARLCEAERIHEFHHCQTDRNIERETMRHGMTVLNELRRFHAAEPHNLGGYKALFDQLVANRDLDIESRRELYYVGNLPPQGAARSAQEWTEMFQDSVLKYYRQWQHYANDPRNCSTPWTQERQHQHFQDSLPRILEAVEKGIAQGLAQAEQMIEEKLEDVQRKYQKESQTELTPEQWRRLELLQKLFPERYRNPRGFDTYRNSLQR